MFEKKWQKFSEFNKNYKLIDPISSPHPKQNKHEENQSNAHI